MSNRDLSYSPPPATSRKRKSAGTAKPSRKRVKTQTDPFSQPKSFIQSILASPDSFALPPDDTQVRNMMVSIAEYAKSLEASVAVGATSSGGAPPPKTAEQIEVEVGRIKNMIVSGISAQMAWKSTCVDGRAKFIFDGVCSDARVFAAMFKQDKPPNWVRKKFTKEEFQEMVGQVRKPIRYDTLKLTGDVNVHWNSDTEEFTISGKYGK